MPQPDTNAASAAKSTHEANSSGVPEPSERGDDLAAIDALRPKAEHDDSVAQCRLGIALAKTAGNNPDRQIEAVKWMDLCIRRYEHPDEEAYHLAHQLTGEFIRKYGWEIVGEGRYRGFQFQQARLNAEAGMPNAAPDFLLNDLPGLSGKAAFQLGSDLYDGENMPVDYEKGFRAFQRAAEMGLPEARYNLGIAYYAGKGIRADPVQALRWFRQSADDGYARAAAVAGVMAARGHGMAQDIDVALTYLNRAAKLGDPDASLMAEAIAAGNLPE